MAKIKFKKLREGCVNEKWKSEKRLHEERIQRAQKPVNV